MTWQPSSRLSTTSTAIFSGGGVVEGEEDIHFSVDASSRTARTFFIKLSGVSGFCRNAASEALGSNRASIRGDFGGVVDAERPALTPRGGKTQLAQTGGAIHAIPTTRRS